MRITMPIYHYFQRLLCLGLLGALGIGFAATQPNALFHHPSPYLAMHGEDPVHWREWNASALTLAKKQNKLLFVSSGYFSCHWCHVMQRESYRNPKIAQFLNEHFIAVKVDREIDSALDAKLIDFVERTQGIAGWPLNAFITPDGYPLVGMVYVPPEQFLTVLQKVAAEWQGSAEKLANLAHAASDEVAGEQAGEARAITATNIAALTNTFLKESFTLADEMQGGFGEENKFPSVPQLQTLLSIYKEQPTDRLKQYLELTLSMMSRLGMRDQLSGGFFRYVVDPGWHTPHFEKMLYDNAQLASLYLQASRILNSPAYAEVARDTLDFMLREFATRNGGFATSLSAIDSHNVEGGYYLWTDTQLHKLLNQDEYQAATTFWSMTGTPELDAGFHLIQTKPVAVIAKELAITEKQLTTRIESARKKLITARNQRTLPKDTKVLAGWNGLTLAVLVDGYRTLQQERYRRAADDIVTQLRRYWWNDKTQTLYRLVDHSRSLADGALDDYAYIALGMYEYSRLTGAARDSVLLEQIVTQAWQRFHRQNGWLTAEKMLLQYGATEPQLKDSVLPSASAVLMNVSLRMGKAPFMDNAQQAMGKGYTALETQSFWHATQIRNLLTYQPQSGL